MSECAGSRSGHETSPETFPGGRSFYQTLIENSLDIVFVFDREGVIRFASPSMEKTLGYAPNELIGRTGFDLIHPDDVPDIRDVHMRGIGMPGLVETHYFRMRHKDGSWCQMEGKGRHMLEDPDIRGIVVSARDITGRKKAEESLRCREKYYRAMIENITDLITVVDADGTILYESPSLERIMGYTPGEVIGKNNFDFVHPDDVPSLLARFTQGIGTPGAVEPFVARIRHKDGSWRLFEGVGKNLLDDPAVGGVVFTSRDITERKRLEEQFLQSQKMETIGRLAGGVAHDLNNILTVILSYAGFAKDALPADSPIKEDIAEVLTASRRATGLIRQILAFSRRQVIRPQIINLNDLILEMDKMLRRLIGEDIRFVTLPAPDLGCVRVDPGQMEQVIANLAVNARDAMPTGGTLLIETANVTIGQEVMDRHMDASPGNQVLLAVSDTGIGMTEEVKRHLFEPFFTTKGPGKGSGLGLATVYGIVKQHKGAIWAYSEPGRGTTFKVYLPRCEEAVDARSQDYGTQPAPGGTETVLLVEDEAPVRNAAERVLKGLGYTVLQAPSGEDALLTVGRYSGEIHLLLTDIVMPGMNGRELAHRLTSLRPGIKVIFMSGYTDAAVLDNGTLREGMEYIQKPFSADTLAAKVRKTLDNSGHYIPHPVPHPEG